MRAPWTPLDSVTRFARGGLRLREDRWRLPDGREVAYPVLEVGVTVAVLPLLDDGRVLLVGQYRHLQRATSWELPGGGARVGETPEEAAQRELQEEGGYRAAQLTRIATFHPSNAYLDEVAHGFVARGLTPAPLPADHDEFLEPRLVPADEAVRMALAGEITESVSVVTLLRWALGARDRA